jgi:uncharacterized protein with HEPN domain
MLMREQLDTVERIAARGQDIFDCDETVRLACEALVMRIGDLAKRLVALEPDLAGNPLWSSAARTRDTLAHHYHRIDLDALWQTVTVSFPTLSAEVDGLLPQRPTGS